MPIALRQKSTSANSTVTFDFGSDSVLSFVTGISYWKFTYGSDDHHVQTMALSLANNQPDPHKVTVRVSSTLSDDSGNNIKNSDSSVHVCCIALTNSTDKELALAGATAIPNNQSSGPISLPGSSLTIASSFLAGFDLSYGSNDHHVRKIHTAAGFTANGTQGAITSQAAMGDDSGNNASTATINGGLVAATPAETGIFAQSVVNQQTSDTVDVDFGRSISDAVVMLQGLMLQFSKDHHVKTLGGGVDSWKVSGNKVSLVSPRAFIKDDSGHDQVDSDSGVSLVVFATP
jgi:hypothetical protein